MTLVFVEVKTRTGNRYGTPEESVTKRKLSDVVKTAGYYNLLHPNLPELLQIDVIAITMNEQKKVTLINHIKNVTG
jgi:putative endonuclease